MQTVMNVKAELTVIIITDTYKCIKKNFFFFQMKICWKEFHHFSSLLSIRKLYQKINIICNWKSKKEEKKK